MYRFARIPRSLLALLAATLFATALGGTAPARPLPPDYGAPPAARAVDLSDPDARTVRIAHAQERYLASYGAPESRAQSTTIASGSDGWTLDRSLAVLFLVAAAGAGVIAGRASTRLRRASA